MAGRNPSSASLSNGEAADTVPEKINEAELENFRQRQQGRRRSSLSSLVNKLPRMGKRQSIASTDGDCKCLLLSTVCSGKVGKEPASKRNV